MKVGNFLLLFFLEETNEDDVFDNKEEAYIIANYDTKISNEKEFLKRLIPGLQQSNKKFVLENKNPIKDISSTVMRFVAFNGMFIYE